MTTAISSLSRLYTSYAASFFAKSASTTKSSTTNEYSTLLSVLKENSGADNSATALLNTLSSEGDSYSGLTDLAISMLQVQMYKSLNPEDVQFLQKLRSDITTADYYLTQLDSVGNLGAASKIDIRS